jgi:hypothetical protein
MESFLGGVDWGGLKGGGFSLFFFLFPNEDGRSVERLGKIFLCFFMGFFLGWAWEIGGLVVLKGEQDGSTPSKIC